MMKNSTEILNKLKENVFKLQVFLHTIFLRFILRYLRKPIGDISLDGLGQDWTLRSYILHLNDI